MLAGKTPIQAKEKSKESTFFSRRGSQKSEPFFQPQLIVGPVDDPYEREADAMAEKVLENKDVKVERQFSKATIQPKCSSCGEEELQRKEDEQNEEAPAVTNLVSETLNSSGEPLDKNSQTFMENRFGYDFSNVRIHTNSLATKSANSINALAYTSGNNIVFNEGQFRPNTDNGKKLLAHELTHVVQQNSGKVSRKVIQRQFSGTCESMLRSPSTERGLSGNAVHAAILADFTTRVPGAIGIAIPGASAAPLRSQGLCGEDATEIVPQVLGGRAGMGFPDLVRWNAGILEVAEIKPASFGCAIDGEAQLFGYITQGNAPDPPQTAWRAAHGIFSVVPMLPTTYTPLSIITPGFSIMISWCTPGLMVYKVTRRQRQRERQRQRQEQRSTTEQPATRRQEQSNWDMVIEFIEGIIHAGGNVEESIRRFLTENPQLIDFIIWAGIGGIVATILEDIATAGIGIADDPLIISICVQMIRIARGLKALSAAPAL